MASHASLGYGSAVLLTAVLSFLLTGIATWYARRRGMLDHPGERHSHRMATPRGGGVGLVAAFLLAVHLLAPGEAPGWWRACAVPCVVILAGTGWWDDHASLGAGIRFLIQLAVSFLLLWCAANAGWMQGVVPVLLGVISTASVFAGRLTVRLMLK